MKAWTPEQIRDFRLNVLRMSQKEFSQHIKVPRETLAGWETRRVRPRPHGLRMLQDAWDRIHTKGDDCPGHVSCTGMPWWCPGPA